uniref:Peptidase_M13_N domain-containing protein n=1 Tax=Panagrellus redivivus TaxID=6233 RepID=A0A7E4ZVL9_PANRE
MAEDGESSAPEASTPGNELTQLTTTDQTNPSVFYVNPRTLTVTLGPSSDEDAIRFCGYIDETDLAKAAQLVRDACLRQEDGIRGDKYNSDLHDALGYYKQRDIIADYGRQSTDSSSTIRSVYPNIPILLPNEEDDLWRDPPSRGNLDTHNWCIRRFSWLHVPLPEIFNYTAAIMRNRVTQGLLHTLLRHAHQWEAHIPALTPLLDKVKKYRAQIETISNPWKTYEDVQYLLYEFDKNFLRKPYDKINYEELQIFSDMQMLIYDFIWNNTSVYNYVGEGCSPNGYLRVLFNTKTANGDDTVMFVAMSNALYYKEANFYPDDRPFRTIVTVFFDDRNTAIDQCVMKMFTLANDKNFNRVVTEMWNYNRPREDKTRYSRLNRFQ